jgi:hypothetical protein
MAAEEARGDAFLAVAAYPQTAFGFEKNFKRDD